MKGTSGEATKHFQTNDNMQGIVNTNIALPRRADEEHYEIRHRIVLKTNARYQKRT